MSQEATEKSIDLYETPADGEFPPIPAEQLASARERQRLQLETDVSKQRNSDSVPIVGASRSIVDF